MQLGSQPSQRRQRRVVQCPALDDLVVQRQHGALDTARLRGRSMRKRRLRGIDGAGPHIFMARTADQGRQSTLQTAARRRSSASARCRGVEDGGENRQTRRQDEHAHVQRPASLIWPTCEHFSSAMRNTFEPITPDLLVVAPTILLQDARDRPHGARCADHAAPVEGFGVRRRSRASSLQAASTPA